MRVVAQHLTKIESSVAFLVWLLNCVFARANFIIYRIVLRHPLAGTNYLLYVLVAPNKRDIARVRLLKITAVTHISIPLNFGA
jgi:hypothetical protein